MCGYTDLLCRIDQIQVGHQLADSGYHLTGKTSGCTFDHVRSGSLT